MTDEKFEELISRPESSVLDFKADLYNFTNEKDDLTIGKFVKDVISFTNTIREESAFIIFGIKELEDNTKEKLGISKNIDDGIFQDKIKNKLYPIPKFKYFTQKVNGMTFGIMEFPVCKYEFPITSTVKLKGIEIGKTYYRQGSTNTEALSLDIIKINNWLQSLPEIENSTSVQSEIAIILKRLLTQEEKLSEILPDIYLLAKTNSFTDLKNFCELEIKGIDVNDIEIMNRIRNENENFKYRAQTIKISLNKIIHSPYHSSDQIKQEMHNLENFFDAPYFFKESISYIENLKNELDGYGTIKMSVKDVLPNYEKDYPVYGYLFKDNFRNLYQNIRQKLIDLIMGLK